MDKLPAKRSPRPLLYGIATLLLLLAMTQFVAYQRYLLIQKSGQDELEHELTDTKERFRTLLSHNISSMNTLAVIYRQYGTLNNFDSIANDLMTTNNFIDNVQFTDKGIVTHAYPLKGNEMVIGFNLFTHPARRTEALFTVKKKQVHFAGPYDLVQGGGKAIVGRLPVFINNEFRGFSVVLTKLSTIRRYLVTNQAKNNKFTYQLSKVNPNSSDTQYFFSGNLPGKDFASTDIPEGNWKLHVGYTPGYLKTNDSILLSLFGILLSIIGGAFVYSRAKLPAKLQHVIASKTQQILSSEKYFRTLIESSTDVIVLFDETGNAIYRTPSFEKVLGYTPEELVGIPSIDLVHPEDREAADAAFRKIVDAPGSIMRQQHRLKHKNGQYIYVDGTYRNLLNDGVVNAIVYVYTDVTERVKSIQNLDKYNREITLLNKINDIILRVDDEHKLLDEICTCIVTSGEYILSWVSYKPDDSDKEQLIRPAVAQGRTDYLDEIKISLKDPELSIGPTATVLTTGQKVVTNDVTISGRFKPWFERAQKYGIAASLVLPLKFDDHSSGAINIYSANVDAFNEHEVSILERLAFNTSVAVNAIRTKLEKTKVEYNLGERVKELATIYQLNMILQQVDWTSDDIFEEIVKIIPQGWQYPGDCEARIHFDNKDYTTKGYKASPYKQRADFELIDKRKGFIEVIYTTEKPSETEGCFLKEERDLIDTIAGTIAVYFNKSAQQRILLESESRFRGAFEYAAIGMALTSLEGKGLMVNRALGEMLGYTEQELLSLSFVKLTHPEDVDESLKYTQQLLEGKINYYRINKRFIHKNGSIVWGSLNVALIRDDAGKPLYFVSQIKNITERIESQQKFQNLVEQSLVGVYIIQNEKFVYVNPKIIEDSGYTEEELTTLPIESFIFKEDMDFVKKYIEARLLGKIDTVRYEVRVRSKNGSQMWMEMFGSVTTYKGAPAIIGTMVDVTEKKSIYNELAKSEAHLRSVFEATETGYVLLDHEFNILALNNYLIAMYKEQTGITLCTGKNFIEALLPHRVEDVRSILTNVMASKKSIEYETTYLKNGETKYYTVNVAPILADGEAIGLCMANYDNTAKKNLELERQHIIQDLVQRNKDLEQFSYILSHNLRAPISTTLGLSNLFKAVKNTEETSTIVAGIEQSIMQLDTVVRDLNEILSIKDSITEIKTNIVFEDIAGNVQQMLSEAIHKTNAKIICDFSDAPQITSISAYMTSIFYNLISNSLKYVRPGITPVINITSTKKDGGITLSFKDNGLGIDLNKHGDQVFGLYKRFHTAIEGKGLGLYIVKTEVTALNGNIEVKSMPGKGTEFLVSFTQ